jgi:glycosyltransferase involved in cell wall biosynthesis
MAKANLSVLLVSSGTTLGQATSDVELENVLKASGVEVTRIIPQFFRLHRHLIRRPFNDLAQALALTLAVRRHVRHSPADVYIYATTTATMFEPKRRLKTAALRFDALTCENRPGKRNILQRRLERRAMRYLPLLMPWSSASGLARDRYFTGDRVVLPFPPPAGTPTGEPIEASDHDVLCYAAAPKKKGLDIMVSAWAQSQHPDSARLLVTGIDDEAGRAYLADEGISVPDSVHFLGRIPREDFGSYLKGVPFYLCGGRYEDFGMAQLEALAAGAVLVTSAAGGPYEARQVMQKLDERLLSPIGSAQALGAALTVALSFSPEERADFSRRAQVLLSPYLQETYQARCEETLLPELRRIAGRPAATDPAAQQAAGRTDPVQSKISST